METHLNIAKNLADLLDNRFRIFGIRFGLDPLIGMIPWLGDFVSLFLGFYIIWIAIHKHLPQEEIDTMIRNLIVDFIIGLVPFIGDLGDFFFKSNHLNWEILQNHLHIDSMEGKLIC